MINERENGYLTVGLAERSSIAETSMDVSLPDYQSEIRRVLNVTATPLPPAKYVGADTVEFNGTVDYQVLYVGGDGELYSIPLSGEYSFSVPYERGECENEDVSVLCSICTESASARVSAPRRLSVRARLRPTVRIYGKRSTQTAMLSEVDPMSVYKNEQSCACVCCESVVSDAIELNAVVPLASDDVRVVSADTRICVESCERGENVLKCRGKARLRLLCAGEEEYSVATESIPFEGCIELPIDVSDGFCRVRGVVCETSVSVSERSAQCGIGILLEASVGKTRQAVYTSDVYSTKNECECRADEVLTRRLIACESSGLTLSERVPLASTGIPEDAQIVDTLCTVCFDRCDAVDSRPTFGGNAEFCVVYKKDDEVYASTVRVPMKYAATSLSDSAPVSFDCYCEAVDVFARVEKGELRLGAELLISAECMGESEVCFIESARFAEPLERRESEMIVCYPVPDDTLWSVAKRYKVAPSDVVGDPTEDKYVIIE